jgi:hypothetical protein
MLRSLLIVLTVLVIQLALAVVVITALVVKPADPALEPPPAVTVADLERLRALLPGGDPRKLVDGRPIAIRLGERDIDLLLQQALTRLPMLRGARAQASLEAGSGLLRLTLAIPRIGPLGDTIPMAVRVRAAGGTLSIDEARIGSIPLPGWLVEAALRVGPWLLPPSAARTVAQGLRELWASTGGWSIGPQRLEFGYLPQRDLARRLATGGRDLVLPPADRARIAHYLAHAGWLATTGGRPSQSMLPMLRDIVAEAESRSRQGGDALAESRAAVLGLAIYAVGRGELAARALGVAIPPGRPVPITLLGRPDLAQHWLVSAALALEADARTADAIGVFKEVLDSRGGSGFSFADLAADRAGVRFGEAARTDPRRWQSRVAITGRELDLMPAIDTLPEGLQEPAFMRRFQARDNEAWAQMRAEIERRIAACRFFAVPG